VRVRFQTLQKVLRKAFFNRSISAIKKTLHFFHADFESIEKLGKLLEKVIEGFELLPKVLKDVNLLPFYVNERQIFGF
jgi:hypothetical protein